MKKLVMLCTLLLLFSMSSWAQVTVTIGTGTFTERYPLNDFYKYSLSQCLYLSSEIGWDGTITKLRWYRNDTGADPSAIGTTTIYLMETTKTTLSGTTWEGPGTLVAAISDIDLGSGGGWYEIDITDFEYSGTQNLLVSVYTQDAPYTSPHSWWRYTAANNMASLGGSDTENPPTLELSSNRPNIQLDMIPTSPYFSIAPSSLAFGYVAFPGSSAEQSYTISGDNLTAGPVVVTAPTGFGVSLTSGGPYTSTVNVSYTPPTLATTTIYANFSPLADMTPYNGNITNVGGGASSDVAVTGSSDLFSLYCASGASYTGNEEITNVTFGTTLNNTSDCASLTGSQGVATGTADRYSNFTANTPTDVSRGVTYPLSVEITECGGSSHSHDVRVYIDFNQNGSLADAGEEFIIWPYASSNTHVITANITIPVDAIEGNTLMRVVCKESSTNGPCLVSSWGETEDYKINITAPPACIPPSELKATNIETNSADLEWTAGGAGLWNIEYGPHGFTPGTGTIIHNVTNPYTLEGLAHSTIYDYYVQDSCDALNVSMWSLPFSFTTSCGIITNFPFIEDFTAGLVPPTCWSEIITNTTENWKYFIDGTKGYATVFSDYSQDEWLVTPVFDFTSLTHPYLSFDWIMSYVWGVDPYNNYDLNCKISTDGGSTWTLLWTETDEGVFNDNEWLTKFIDLAAYAGEPSVKIAWQYVGDDGSMAGIDNIVVGEYTIPVITSLSSTSGCVGSSLTIKGENLMGVTSVTIGGTAATITGNTDSTVIVTVGTGTTGIVVVTNAYETATSTETFTVIPLPAVFTVSGGGTYCAGGTGVSITLDGSVSGINYELSTTPVTTLAGTGSALTFGPSAFETGVYTITAVDTLTACSIIMTGNADVTANPVPTAVTATASSNTICEGASIDLFSSAMSNDTSLVAISTEGFETMPAPPADWTFINAGAGHNWSFSFTAHSGGKSLAYAYSSTEPANVWAITNPLTLNADTTYTLSFWYKTAGEGYSEKLKVTVGNDATVLAQTTTLWDNNGDTALFNETWEQAVISFNPVTSGTYYFGFNCYSNTNMYMLYIDDVEISGPVINPATYSWTSDPDGFTSNQQNPTEVTPSETTEYIVTVENSYGCIATNSTTVVMNPLPTATVSIDNDTVCAGDEILISINLSGTGPWLLHGLTRTEVGGSSYTLPDTIVDSSPFQIDDNPILSTDYHIESYTDNSTGCTNDSANWVSVFVKELPTAIVQVDDDTICIGDTITISISLSGSGPWLLKGLTKTEFGGSPESLPDTLVNTSPFIIKDTPHVSAYYHIESFEDYSTGCSNDSANWVTVFVNPLPDVNLGNDTTICADQYITLDAGNIGAEFLWTPGESINHAITLDGSVLGTGSFTYSVDVNLSGCVTSDTIVVTFDPCTGINENGEGVSISIVPNPSNGLFHLSVEGIEGNSLLTIYSINGQIIFSEQVDNSGLVNKPIDLKSFPKGMYFLHLINNNLNHTEKIIIE